MNMENDETRSIAEADQDNGFHEDEFNEPIVQSCFMQNTDTLQTGHVKIIELLPENGFPHDRSIVDLVSLDPVAYAATEEGLIRLDEAGPSAVQFIQQPLATAGGIATIPPAVLKKVFTVADPEEEDGRILEPIIHGYVTPRLSVSDDGFMKLGNYKISFDVIGGGKLSEVRVAFNETDGRKYAVKIFSKTKLRKVSMLRRASRSPVEDAYREAALLRRLNHENVIKMCDFIDDPDDENIYLVLEFMDRVLMDLPSDFYYSERDARRYFRQVKEGVKHLHGCGVVHRDLKPQNLLVTKHDVVRIADFNFCDELVLKDDGNEAALLTAVQGTPAFTAPECLLPDERFCAGRPLDVWGLGATLYVLVTGELPFTALLLPELFEAIIRNPVEFPADIPLSCDLKDLILRVLEKDPKKRVTMNELAALPWLQAT